MRSREKQSATSDLSTADLKAIHARPDAKVPANERDDNHRRGVRRLGHLGIGGLVAGLAVTGVFISGKILDSGDTPERNTRENPAPTATANPGETDPASQPAGFGIDTQELASNPEALATEYYNQLNQFLIAGADEKAADADERFTMKDSEYVEVISQDIDQKFIDELFVADWQNNPQLASYVNGVLEVAHSTRWDRLESYAGGTANKEPYVHEYIVDEASGTTDPLVTSTRWHGHDNGDMTTADDNNAPDSIDPNTERGSNTITWVKIDGQLKISDINY